MTQPASGYWPSPRDEFFLGIGRPFGTIAYSPQTRRWGYAIGHSTVADAKNAARNECGARDAAVWPGCACYLVLAIGPDGCYGFGDDGKRELAERKALQGCGQYTNEPHIVLVIHTKYGVKFEQQNPVR